MSVVGIPNDKINNAAVEAAARAIRVAARVARGTQETPNG